MKPLLTLLVITLTVPLQTHIISLFPHPVPLDLALIVTYYYGYFHGKSKGMVIGAYLGILTDILSGELLGSQMFLKTLVGYLAALCGLGVLSRDLPVHFLLLVLFSFANGLLNLFLVNLFGGSIPVGDALSVMIFPSIFWNALVGTLFIVLVRRGSLHTPVFSSDLDVD